MKMYQNGEKDKNFFLHSLLFLENITGIKSLVTNLDTKNVLIPIRQKQFICIVLMMNKE